MAPRGVQSVDDGDQSPAIGIDQMRPDAYALVPLKNLTASPLSANRKLPHREY
jgi:hypothetical protein